MDILSIPFHKFLNINRADGYENFVFKIQERPEYLNHLGTIHACVQLSLAEATSGEFLLKEFGDLKTAVIPVVRKSEAKYHKPANGELFSTAEFLTTNRSHVLNELNTKKRAIVHVKVEVWDYEKNKTLTVIFEWFLILK